MSDQVITPVAHAGLSIPDYELLRPIGRGAYGEVWLARNVTGSCVALKIVHRSAFDHDRPFEREFNGIKRFEPISRSDPSQVAILHVGLGEGFFYYVMELADQAEGEKGKRRKGAGEKTIDATSPSPPFPPSPPLPFSPAIYAPLTLKRLLNDRGRLPSDECVAIALSLTRALARLHGHGLVHRDVKLSNVIFVNGQAKLADIGLVTSVDATRSFVGTEGYLPPEGAGTPQADLYSLGKVLYEMSTGCDRKEFPALPPDIATRPDRDALAELNAIVVRACQLDPRERYQNAEEMLADVALLQRGQSVRRKHTAQRCWAVARTFAFAAVLLALFVALPISIILKHGKTPNPAALRLYDQGRWFQNQLTDQSLHKAIAYLDQAIQIDPDYVQPYTALLGIYTWGVQGISDEEKNQKVKWIADKLLRLNPNLPDGHLALSWSKYCEGDWRRTEAEILRALQLKPDYPQAHGFYCYYLSLLGRVEEAKEHGKLAQELDPLSRIHATLAGYPFVTARQYGEAIAQFRKALDLDPYFPLAHLWIAKCYEAQSNYPAAIEEFETSDRLVGDDSAKLAQRYQTLREAFAAAGEKGYWQKVLELELGEAAIPDEQKKVTQHDRWFLPGVYARLGQKEKALDLLEKDAQTSGASDWLKLDPLYHSLSDEPRFKALLKQAGLEK